MHFSFLWQQTEETSLKSTYGPEWLTKKQNRRNASFIWLRWCISECAHMLFSDWFEIITHNYTHFIWHFSPSRTESRLESVAIMCCCVGRVIKPEANIRPSRSQSQSSVCPSHAPSTHTSTSLQYIFSSWLSFQMTVPWMFPGEVRSSQSWAVFFFFSFFPPKSCI